MLRDSGFGKPEEHWPSKIAVLTYIVVLILAARNSQSCSGAAPRDPERTRGRLLREAFEEVRAQNFETLTCMSFWPQQEWRGARCTTSSITKKPSGMR